LRPGIPAYSMERISISWSPTKTTSPGALPIRAHARGRRKKLIHSEDPPLRGICADRAYTVSADFDAVGELKHETPHPRSQTG